MAIDYGQLTMDNEEGAPARLSIRMPQSLLRHTLVEGKQCCAVGHLYRELIGKPRRDLKTSDAVTALERKGLDHYMLRSLVEQNDGTMDDDVRLSVFRGFCKVAGIEVRDE